MHAPHQHNSVIIRRASAADAAALAELAARTFADWFGAENSAEDMAAHLQRSYGEELQRREIEDRDWVTLLAESDGRAIAYAQVKRGEAPACVWTAAAELPLSKAAAELPQSKTVEIARFYVDRNFHGKGIAQTLMAHAIIEARKLGGETIWLGVWERNARAIAFYEKCGFRDRGSHPFLVGSDLQTDRVMVLQR
ncbi:MAG TPA: GNAT family N-acetyltransferase [Thermoanaerobaculia bacterium]|nr:GNAT family N-acetyltransferase [Thermoanaerobaculia bacterium]